MLSPRQIKFVSKASLVVVQTLDVESQGRESAQMVARLLMTQVWLQSLAGFFFAQPTGRL